MSRRQYIEQCRAMGGLSYEQWLEQENTQLKAELEQATQREARLRKAMELYKRASYQGHSAHWDRTGGSGTGCPACLEARELRNQAEQALQEIT